MGSVSLQNVSKSFGNVNVIKDVSIEIDDGEFCVLIGPSGSGKSTLLRIIAGLETVTDGEVLIGDKQVTDFEPKERDIAMVFQSYSLYPQMTVRENMGFALKLAKRDKKFIDKEVLRVAKMLELEHLLDRLPKALSGGQRQRVSMGRAIVRQPKAYLFDEPLSNLDAKLRTQVRGEIAAMHEQLGTTSVYVTHDQIEAMTLGQKIVVLKDGSVEQIGSPMELYGNPKNMFVAGFIGSPSINFLEATVKSEEGSVYALLTSGDKITLGENYRKHDGMNVFLGIRPEHILIDEATESFPHKVTISHVENTGSDMLVYFELNGIKMRSAFKEQKYLMSGMSVSIKIEEDKVLLFNSENENRVY
ncbi:ABC transporter ATP-binding protein [Vibrio nigripulchritudo]|uniref:ABC transporter ATP-binding protein n=1 Tax=Vibrio nigripulchritudo TaxID=28173 RepID=UPI0003B2011B|nr:sn-glycerol-3-phosphate ABC transporter ATP-binding protein UgpC [Vibrio nigripulchritudo]CCN73639.1 putative sugar ABC transporter, ATP-binding protein [Vibrio nigripulchritudo SFn118]